MATLSDPDRFVAAHILLTRYSRVEHSAFPAWNGLAVPSTGRNCLGQLSREDNDFNNSRKYFQEALTIDRNLQKREPGRRQWQENLVFSLTRIGDLEKNKTQSNRLVALRSLRVRWRCRRASLLPR